MKFFASRFKWAKLYIAKWWWFKIHNQCRPPKPQWEHGCLTSKELYLSPHSHQSQILKWLQALGLAPIIINYILVYWIVLIFSIIPIDKISNQFNYTIQWCQESKRYNLKKIKSCPESFLFSLLSLLLSPMFMCNVHLHKLESAWASSPWWKETVSRPLPKLYKAKMYDTHFRALQLAKWNSKVYKWWWVPACFGLSTTCFSLCHLDNV